ncbi:inovirus Gp2 family protein, partial [Salmonella enterica subsp. enterica]|nr:inovirus Gp2 family protein [Salmonella enterica subsp. enterica serovar Java]
MNPRMNPFWRQRIAGTFHNTLDAYPRVLMLRFPDCPAAVISRFTDPLKAKIDAYIKRKQHEGKRVHATTLRFIWVREFG